MNRFTQNVSKLSFSTHSGPLHVESITYMFTLLLTYTLTYWHSVYTQVMHNYDLLLPMLDTRCYKGNRRSKQRFITDKPDLVMYIREEY